MNQRAPLSQLTVLVVPLDWGLGHATRCIPLIKTLTQQQCKVILAGEDKTKILLRETFPELIFLPLEGYRIRYSRAKWSFPFTIAAQVPQILSTIKKEHHWLGDIVKKYKVNGIISDNRYGLYHGVLPSVFVTHQLQVKTGLGKSADALLQKLNYRLVNRFSECWIPDEEKEPGLAGELSHPQKFPAIQVKYTGILSRFRKKLKPETSGYILILLSGPEPQRTIFENMVLSQLNVIRLPVVLVRGLPGNTEQLKTLNGITSYNYLGAEELQQKMEGAAIVISRCGYSTVMDLAALAKKSILIPTPGQTEQEYLAHHLMQSKFALCIEQKKFNLRAALDLSETFDYCLPRFENENQLQELVCSFLASIRKQKLLS